MRTALACVVLGLTGACATTRFDRAYSQQRWDDAAEAFQADTSLLWDERALFRAGMLYGTAGRAAFDPERSRQALSLLLMRFPNTRHRAAAAERLAMVEEIARARAAASRLDSTVASLDAELRLARARLDSARTRQDVLQALTSRLEEDVREREEELRALRLELQALKEIDLRRRPTGGPSPRP